MKKILLIACLAWFGLQAAFACDGGCSLGSSYGGIFPQWQKNFIGINYRYSFFRYPMTHNALGRKDEFRVLELQGRFYLNPRLELWLSLPYGFFQQSHQRTQTTYNWNGIGDLRSRLQYTLFQKADSSLWRHRLLLGGELSLPTGTYQKTLENGNAIEAEGQLGTGAWSLQLSTTYILRYGHWGANLNLAHRRSTRNEIGYRFGQQTQAQAQFFYEWQPKFLPDLRILPQVGAGWETRKQDDIDKSIDANTGGESLQAQVGIDLFVRTWQLGAYAQRALWEEQPFEQASRPWRWQLSLRHAF